MLVIQWSGSMPGPPLKEENIASPTSYLKEESIISGRPFGGPRKSIFHTWTIILTHIPGNRKGGQLWMHPELLKSRS